MTHKQKKSFSSINNEGDIEPNKRDKKERKDVWNIPPEYINLGFYLALPLLLAVFIGPKLDAYFQTGHVFTLLFILFGTISVFYNLYKLYKQG